MDKFKNFEAATFLVLFLLSYAMVYFVFHEIFSNVGEVSPEINSEPNSFITPNQINESLPLTEEVTDQQIPTAAQEDIVIGTSTTAFQSYGRLYSNRARNIRLAARILNGTVVEPGQVFSFNEVVGPRDRQHGFREAPTIIAGEMSESYGGGVCQVASTLFSAVLYAGLTIEETRPHSHYMHYIDPGFDSTVFYEYVDLRFTNNFDFPIRIQTSVSDNNELSILVLGREQIYSVLVDVHTLFRRRIETQRIQNLDLEPGRERIVDLGTSRMRVRRTVTYTPTDGHEQYPSRVWVTAINYQPTPRVIEYN